MKEFDEQNDELQLLEEDDEILGVDEEIKRNHDEDEDTFPGINEEPENIEKQEAERDEKASKSTDSFRVVLRDELARPEYNRGWFKFNYRGEKYIGKVLHEINPNKFVFLIDDNMKGIWINEATVLK